MVEVIHTVPAVAYIVQSQDRAFAFTGDTARAPKLWKALNQIKQLDALIVECSFAEYRENIAQMAMHYSPRSLAHDLEELQHDPVIRGDVGCHIQLQHGLFERGGVLTAERTLLVRNLGT